MALQEIEIRGQTEATAAEVWRLLADSSTWPSWTPIESCEINRPAASGVNEIRTFKTGRVTVREEIVERIENERLSYELLAGLPVRDYRAEIDLTPSTQGTEIRWHTTFMPRFAGTGWVYRRALEKATQRFVDGLMSKSAR